MTLVKVCHTCCDVVFDLVDAILVFLACEHALCDTYVEAPNAHHAHRSIKTSSKLISIGVMQSCGTSRSSRRTTKLRSIGAGGAPLQRTL